MERTHQGISTSEVWKSYWPWCRYNEVKCQLHIWPWNLELSRSRSQTKVPMERTHQGLHLKCLRVIDHGLATMKFNAKNIFDLETWNLQGQGHRQRSQWVELIKVYLHVKFERGIVNGHSAALNLIARAKPNCWCRQTDGRHPVPYLPKRGTTLSIYMYVAPCGATHKIK